jgi:hypothetical protein
LLFGTPLSKSTERPLRGIFFFSPEVADTRRIDSLVGSAYRQR